MRYLNVVDGKDLKILFMGEPEKMGGRGRGEAFLKFRKVESYADWQWLELEKTPKRV